VRIAWISRGANREETPKRTDLYRSKIERAVYLLLG
jgi:hypothetical protein